MAFHGTTFTSDAGLLAYRELDDALGLTNTAASGLHDTRTGQNTQHSLRGLLRQSICSRLAGYEVVNDAERLRLDPALQTVVGGRAQNATAASTRAMARFETETLSTKENLKQLMDLSGLWIENLGRAPRGDDSAPGDEGQAPENGHRGQVGENQNPVRAVYGVKHHDGRAASRPSPRRWDHGAPSSRT